VTGERAFADALATAHDSGVLGARSAWAEILAAAETRFADAFARHRRLLAARAHEGAGDPLHELAGALIERIDAGDRASANAVFSRYLQRRPDEAGLALLPLYLAFHAPADQADGYLEASPGPRLLAVGGLSGSGKSGIAARLAPDLGIAPGALILRSDVERKRLAGVAPEVELPAEAYTPEASDAVYDSLFARARAALAAGHSVVLDAVFAKPEERRRAREVARRANLSFQGLWLDCPEAVRAARVGTRSDDASDARADVARWQSGLDLGLIDWARIDASPGQGAVFEAVRAALEAGQFAGGPRSVV
jgi:uncharacterized protein